MFIISTDQIANLNVLPIEIQEEIKAVKQLEFRGLHCVQEILGRNESPEYILCLAGMFKMFWINNIKKELFEITSYGSDKWQWSWISGIIPS